MANFFKSYDSSVSLAIDEQRKPALALLHKLGTYLEKANYTSFKYASSYYRYRHLTTEERARLLEVTKSAVRQRYHWLSKELWGIFGEDFFQRLDNEDYDYCEQVYKETITVQGYEDLLGQDIRRIVFDKATEQDLKLLELSNVDPGTFVKEIEFLASLATPTLEKAVENLSLARLAYLLALLDGKVGTLRERANFASFLKKEQNNDVHANEPTQPQLLPNNE